MDAALIGIRAALIGARAVRQRRAAVDPTRAAAAEEHLAALFATVGGAGRGLRASVLAHPLRSLGALRHAGRLPTLDVSLPDTVDGRAIRSELQQHTVLRRIARALSAVLPVPDDPAALTSGPRRATFRQNVRLARRHGVTVGVVPRQHRAALLEAANRHEQHGAREHYRVPRPMNDDLPALDLWLAARAQDGTPLALAVVPVAGEWAALRYLRTLSNTRAASDARYLLTAELAAELRRRGVHHLIDTVPPWWLPEGLRYFQRRLGFRLVRLRIAG